MSERDPRASGSRGGWGAAHTWMRQNILGLVAIFIALSGSAAAMQVASQDGAKTAKAKKGPRGPRGPAGPAGPAGSAGLQGPPGPSTGPAGGDLTGSYPDPTIGSGVVTPVKIGSIPAVRVQSPDNAAPGFCSWPQSIPGTSAETVLGFAGETFDTANMHLNSCDDPNRSKLTAPIAGLYQVNAQVAWEGNVTGSRFLGIRANGATYIAASRIPATGGDVPEQSVSTLINLNAGDYVEAVVNQNSGATLSTVFGGGSSNRNHMTMAWEGPG